MNRKSSDSIESAKALKYDISVILRDDWHPIGKDDCPHDEYDAYIPVIQQMILRGSGGEEIYNYLRYVETEYMGMRGETRIASVMAAEKLANLSADQRTTVPNLIHAQPTLPDIPDFSELLGESSTQVSEPINQNESDTIIEDDNDSILERVQYTAPLYAVPDMRPEQETLLSPGSVRKVSNVSNVTNIRTAVLAPFQSKAQLFMLDVHATYCAIVRFLCAPFIAIGETFTSTSMFRDFNRTSNPGK